MIEWYKNKELSIFFDDVPHVSIRYVLPSDTDAEVKSKKKFPFINKRSLEVRIFDHKKGRTYGFTIPKGYCFDGASIPRFFWRVIGTPTDNSFLIAALVHDVMCENHHYVMNDRQLSSDVFNALLETSQVGKFKRYLMKHSVNLFQRFCGWDDKQNKKVS